MAKAIKKIDAAIVQVQNISPAAMKVILAKIKATNPGSTREFNPDPFAKGPTEFKQSGDHTKFSRPGESDISIQGADFKINAESVKAIERQ